MHIVAHIHVVLVNSESTVATGNTLWIVFSAFTIDN